MTQIDLFSLGVTRRCRTNTGEDLLYNKENAHLSSFELESMPHTSSLSSPQLINFYNELAIPLSEFTLFQSLRPLSTGHSKTPVQRLHLDLALDTDLGLNLTDIRAPTSRSIGLKSYDVLKLGRPMPFGRTRPRDATTWSSV